MKSEVCPLSSSFDHFDQGLFGLQVTGGRWIRRQGTCWETMQGPSKRAEELDQGSSCGEGHGDEVDLRTISPGQS